MKSFFVKNWVLISNILSFGILYVVRQVAKKRNSIEFDFDKDGIVDATITFAQPKEPDKAESDKSKKSA